MENVNTRPATVFFSFPELRYSPLGFKSSEILQHLSNKRDGINAIKFEAVRIHFLGDVLLAVAVVVT